MWQEKLLLWLHSHSTSLLDRLFLLTQPLGTTIFFVVLVTVAVVWHFVRNERRETVMWIFVGVGILIVKLILKMGVARSRPMLWPPLVAETGYSFPSGHALGAAAFYPLFTWTVLTARSKRRWLWMGVAVLIALIVGVARLYMGVHWPTDVLAGWAIGFAATAVAIAWLKGLFPKRTLNPKESFAISPFSTALWTKYPSFDRLPYLKEGTALNFLLFGAGIGAALLFGVTPSAQDPLMYSSGGRFVLPGILLFGVTGYIGFKQYNYYYREGSRKDGIFKQKLRQTNEAERTLDALLAFWGGLLFPFSFVPTWWYLIIASYSVFVVMRCHLTSKRKRYWERDGSLEATKFIPMTLEGEHNGLKTREVLAGWVCSHCIFLTVAIGFFVFLRAHPYPGWFYALLVAYFALYTQWRLYSYPITSRVVRWYR